MSSRVGGGGTVRDRHDDPGAAEQIEIRTRDGVALRADVREPARGSRLVGVAILAHAMFARRGEFERPHGDGLARFLRARGWRTIAFDFRGHGDSGTPASKGGSWSYDDLAQRDLPAVVACARDRSRRVPVAVFGHSLGGHVALAGQGIGAHDADAIVLLGASLWLPAWEPSLRRWVVKRAVVAACRRILEKRGYFPARALRQGSDDESYASMSALLRTTERGTWQSDDGRHDYRARLRDVRARLFAIASDGDRLRGHPDCVARIVSECGARGAPHEIVRIRKGDDGGAPPGHMQLVTTARAASAWARAEAFARTSYSARAMSK